MMHKLQVNCTGGNCTAQKSRQIVKINTNVVNFHLCCAVGATGAVDNPGINLGNLFRLLCRAILIFDLVDQTTSSAKRFAGVPSAIDILKCHNGSSNVNHLV